MVRAFGEYDDTPRKTMIIKPFRILGLVILVIIGLAFSSKLFFSMGADEIVVNQYPSGTLVWHKDPGIKLQWFGRVTRYHKRSQFWFSSKTDQGANGDESIKVRFNDAGHANISGSIAWEMPLDVAHLNMIHSKYGSQRAIEQQLVRTVVERAVYMTGPLMSSKESSSEKRNDLLQFIEDQVQNGVFRTETQQEKQPDPVTGTLKTVSVVKLIMGKDGKPERTDVSPLTTFGIRTFNPSINEIKYDPTVEAQITEQQKATMQVQTAIANAKQAEQAAITAAKNGEAEAAKAKWAQEVIKATEVTAAEQRKAVAKLDSEAAELKKRQLILEGEGEAAKRKLVMDADGALDKKLAAYVETQKVWADAVKGYQGNWVPSVVSGGSSGGNGAMNLIELLSVKASRELGVELQAEGRSKTGVAAAK